MRSMRWNEVEWGAVRWGEEQWGAMRWDEEQWGADEEFSLKTENSSEDSSVFPQFSYVNHLTRDNYNIVRFSTNPHFLLNSSAPKNQVPMPLCTSVHTAPHRTSVLLIAPHPISLLLLIAPHTTSLLLTAPHCSSSHLIPPHCSSYHLIAPHTT